MELEEQLFQDQVSLKKELANMVPHLSDDTLWDTVLDYRNKNDLGRCINHLLDRCDDTRYQDEATSTKNPNFDWSEKSFRGNNRQPLRIVLIGKTGTGKSSTCNTILGEESFKTCLSASSVTEMCQDVKGVRFGQEVHLVDTPGVFDTSKPNTQVLQEISRCISMSLPGPHVFLLVLQTGRFTPEENDTVKHVAKMFGEDVFKHMLLVFTGRDALERDHQSFDEFLQTIPPSLREIREKCNKRCIAVDNSAVHESRAIDAGNLMEQINVLVEKHNGKYYTNEMYKEAEKRCREREEEIRRQKDKEKKKEIEKVTKQLKREFQKKFDRLQADQHSLQQKIRHCETKKEKLEGRLHNSSLTDEEIAEINEQLSNVEIEALQYKDQVEDAANQRQVCLRNRDRRITQQSKELDRKYENDCNFKVGMSKIESVFTMIKGAAQLGWGFFNFCRWF